ncbi:hypersensitive response inducing protein 1 [Setomelanomma holmii]|uniref:Hypersensitive response inducing protein 1 n=1 Tax=Setomelanomma holmii TaxID=210430 RepID=A0A9P4HIS7_9PLEO|nr:hypersensitive response inducing protein 1 [Setomelanomma holmii]
MRFTIISLVLPALALAAPATFDVRAEKCAPTSYTLSDYTLAISNTSAYVNFNFKSNFADTTGIDDSVITGANCNASGSSIPNSNVCSTPNRKLLFDLRAPQDQAHYQITHTWVCDGKTWMSGNDVTVGPLDCIDVGNGQRTCLLAAPQTIVPQNVRQICNTPTC